jgi:aspartyl-tRNA(Asn)/glutamyl-tRNA(Gln) amidotransferase subunit A
MYLTIHEAAEAIRQRKTTPVDLVEQCLANIDRWEEKVRAWVFVDRDGARAEARRLSDELSRGQYRGPLHGIPLGIKDIFDVVDWPTAAGFRPWANSIAREDADVVRSLRQAGAIFLGKTVTTQFASFDPPVTRNPWNLQHTPGGSSSGSAAAVATGMCLGALGSQTGGSITRPASYCGVAGLKPSHGSIYVNGVVPLAPSMDHVGVMARTVRDLSILYRPLAPSKGQHVEAAIGRPPMGVLKGLFEDMAVPALRDAMAATYNHLLRKEADLFDVPLPGSFSEVLPRHRIVMAVEAAAYHQRRLELHPQDYLPKIRGLIEEGLACPAVEYQRCREHREQLQEDLRQCIACRNLDILLTPATTTPAPDTSSTGDPAFNSPWSYLGWPTVSFPTGQFVDGLPVALQLVGYPRHEMRLLAFATWCEHALGITPLTPPR